MNTEKGMSQILVLIVAAAVLMMVGLLLITLSSNSITGVFQDTSAAACTSQLESQCTTSGADTITADNYPATCRNNGNIIESVPQGEYSCN